MQGVLDGGVSGCVVFACVSCCLSCVCQKVVGDNGSLCMAVLSWWRHLPGSCRLCVRSERERVREDEREDKREDKGEKRREKKRKKDM